MFETKAVNDIPEIDKLNQVPALADQVDTTEQDFSTILDAAPTSYSKSLEEGFNLG